MMQRKFIYTSLILITAFSLSGCLSLKEKAAIKAKQDAVEEQRQLTELRKTFKPPVIIYRIDDHRFFTLEEFNEKREGYTFYNNTKTKKHFKMYNGSACNYHGRLIWAAQYDDNIAFPAVDSNWEGCAGRRNGCQSSVLRYFKGKFVPLVTPLGSITLRPVKETGYFTLVITDNHFYIGKSSNFNYKNEQLSDLSWTKFPYPTSEELKTQTWKSYTSEAPTSEVKTPSGQTHFDCSDPSISPMSKLGDYGQEYRLEK